jgi:hypothetical protein
MATAAAPAAEAPAAVPLPAPIATPACWVALAPATPVAFELPMAMAPWALASGLAVVFVPPPMAIAWVPVMALALEPRATF